MTPPAIGARAATSWEYRRGLGKRRLDRQQTHWRWERPDSDFATCEEDIPRRRRRPRQALREATWDAAAPHSKRRRSWPNPSSKQSSEDSPQVAMSPSSTRYRLWPFGPTIETSPPCRHQTATATTSAAARQGDVRRECHGPCELRSVTCPRH